MPPVLLPLSTFPDLPLLSQGFLHAPADWVELWQDLAQEGPSVLLESAGAISESSRWVFLAGRPQAEFWGKDGRRWLRQSGHLQEVSNDVFDFLDRAGKSTESFRPLPFCLGPAWFG